MVGSGIGLGHLWLHPPSSAVCASHPAFVCISFDSVWPSVLTAFHCHPTFAVINSFLISGNLELAIDLMHISRSTSSVEGKHVHCSAASKKTMRIKRDNECENVWKLYSVTQIEPLLRENRENRTPSEQALFSWSAVQVRQVHQSLRWQESVPASLKAKFLVVQLGGVSIILLSSQETEAHLGYLSSQADCCEDVLRSEGDRKPWKQQHSQVSPGRTPSPSPRQRSWAVPDSLEPRATPSHVPGRCQLLPVPAFCFSSSSSGHFCSCG